MKLAVFVDYDNLLESQKSSGVFNVVTKALMRTPVKFMNGMGTCDVRIYGGWYEGTTKTKRAQDLAAETDREFPAIIRIPYGADGIAGIQTTAVLAYALMEQPGHDLFGTYRKKEKPGNVRVQSPSEVGCADSACLLPHFKSLLKSGNCPVSTCSLNADNLVFRHEQKLVDTMLTCDMIYAPSQNYQHLVLISGDDDFLPPLRTVLLRGTRVTRLHPKPRRNHKHLSMHGVPLTEMDL